MSDIVERLLDYLAGAFGALVMVTDLLTGIGFLVTFVVMAVAGVILSAKAIVRAAGRRTDHDIAPCTDEGENLLEQVEA